MLIFCSVKAEMEHSVMADYSGSPDEWGDQDPSIFEMHIVKTLQGEYQLTNGYGPDEAPKIMMVLTYIFSSPLLNKQIIISLVATKTSTCC